MKLKTKFQDEDFKFEEVADVSIATMPDGRIVARAKAKSGGEHTFYYDTLETFYNDWEDYEEPFSTQFYTIVNGEIKRCIFYSKRIACCPSDAWAYLKDDGREKIKQLKEVGLYFETKEETERAVEKLKAWKRLKDKGFRFDNFIRDAIYYEISDEEIEKDVVRKDLDLLFGGEK